MIRLARFIYYWFYQDWFDGDWRYYVSHATKAERLYCGGVIRLRRSRAALR